MSDATATPGPEVGQPHLFEPPPATHLTLADRFLVPPFSVLDAKSGYWQDRKRDWLALGIRSELGRDEKLLGYESITSAQAQPCPTCNGVGHDEAGKRCRHCAGKGHKYGRNQQATTSVFDPVLCEVAYRWWSPPGGLVYDPFAGGSVRGIVAASLGRLYLGVDLRPEQCVANDQQAEAIGPTQRWAHPPSWLPGDSRATSQLLGKHRPDFIFSCPPYYDLEQYSDDPRDLSNAGSYSAFLDAYETIVAACVKALKPDRFCVFVVGEVRAKDGGYVGLVPNTISAFQDAGATYYNELILQTPLGSAPIRTGAQFGGGRKVGKVHQNVLVFVKGDGKAAATACGTVPEVALEYGGAVWRADGSVAMPSTGEEIDFYDEEDRL